jgi:uncharacterized protein (DUF2147 family)
MTKFTIAAALSLLLQGAAWAQPVPTGLWKTIDDETKQEKSLVRITEAGGVVSAKIEKLLDPSKQGTKCDKCSDDRKDQPVLGMTIIKNVKQNADDKALWDGGEILDPNNGKTYKVRLKPVDGGKAMEVRGYVGAPLLGRTQTWVRVE